MKKLVPESMEKIMDNMENNMAKQGNFKFPYEFAWKFARKCRFSVRIDQVISTVWFKENHEMSVFETCFSLHKNAFFLKRLKRL